MAKNKKELKNEEVKTLDANEAQDLEIKDGENPVDHEASANAPKLSKAEYDAIVKKAEEDALAKVCKSVGTSPKELKQIEKNRAEASKEAEFDIGNISVDINGVTYSGRGKARADIVEHIVSAASMKRERILGETVGRNMSVIGTLNSGITSKELGRVDHLGNELSAE